ncbi:MAG TPA: hypothetical protein VHH32_13655 [Gemmatimonadales bacterium]|nr:hypothetical protein [Gemmatimonadales bacterium]
MSECTWLSDRMAALPADQAEWSAEDQRHLIGCESCRREWELVRAARRLGEQLPDFDPVATNAAVRRRLQEAAAVRTKRIRAWVFAGMAAAAAVAGVVWTGDRPDPLLRSEPVATGFRIPLPELDGLQPAELDSVLRAMDQAPASGATLESTAPADTGNGDLDFVLESWEG